MVVVAVPSPWLPWLIVDREAGRWIFVILRSLVPWSNFSHYDDENPADGGAQPVEMYGVVNDTASTYS